MLCRYCVIMTRHIHSHACMQPIANANDKPNPKPKKKARNPPLDIINVQPKRHP